MAQATIDNFTQLTTEPSLASYLLVLDKTLTAPQTRGNRLYNLLEAIMKGMTVARMDLTSPTTLTPSVGDTYVVAATGTGAWGGQDNNIAVYASASEGWVFLTPDEGWIIYDQNLNLIKLWNGTGWVDPNASNISYDDSGATITASSVQDAIDELDADIQDNITTLATKAPLASPTFTGIPIVPTYTVAGVPTATAGGVIYVSDETGGAVLAFADGTN